MKTVGAGFYQRRTRIAGHVAGIPIIIHNPGLSRSSFYVAGVYVENRKVINASIETHI
jgi:hypothetical protein